MNNINFKISDSILLSNGYIQEKSEIGDNKRYWKKSRIKGREFPRFHIVIEENGEWSIHCDLEKAHGFFLKWIGRIQRSNIVQNSCIIDDEVSRLRFDTYTNILDEMKDKIKEMRRNLK
jgi:hypothetical protein